MKTKNTIQIRYDSDADVWSIESSPSAPIDYAREMGNVVVHFGKDNEPVLIEVLEASHQLRGQTDSLKRVVALAGNM
jgi:uncharacterized protein YuzE